MYCIVSYRIVSYYIVLYCVVLCCVVLCCVVLCCVVLCCVVLCCVVLYCIVLYCIVLYCIVLYCIVLYCISSLSSVGSHLCCLRVRESSALQITNRIIRFITKTTTHAKNPSIWPHNHINQEICLLHLKSLFISDVSAQLDSLELSAACGTIV